MYPYGEIIRSAILNLFVITHFHFMVHPILLFEVFDSNKA